MSDNEHWFVLPGDKMGGILIVELYGPDGNVSRQEIVVPALAGLPVVEDSGQLPVISDVQVLKVERAVFLSATIGWQTDTVADAVVLYGKSAEDLEQTSSLSKRFGRRQEVVLNELQLDRTYFFKGVSHDLFGRSQETGIQTFSTARAGTKAPSRRESGRIAERRRRESGAHVCQ